MIPKEKAKSLVGRMERSKDMPYQYAKQCALIAVDEIQNTKSVYVNDVEYDYWEEVKHEINLL